MTKGWYKRQRVHQHNGFTGHARMMETQLNTIIDSDTTNQTTKDIARRMLKDVELLKQALKTRIDL